MRAAATFFTLFVLCATSFSSEFGSPTGKTAFVAPLYITNDRFDSVLALTNEADNTVDVIVALHSLEGEEIGRSPARVAPRSSISVDVDSIPARQHRFPALGSILISVASPVEIPLIGNVTIRPRTGNEQIQVEEGLQDVDAYRGPLSVGFGPASYSVPVLAIKNLRQTPEPISLVCFDSKRGNYESHLMLPAQTTLLLNACTRGRHESRTYEQLLSGDTGPTGGDIIIKIRTGRADGKVAVWGFVTANTGEGLALQIAGIDFVEWDPSFEFLLEPDLGANLARPAATHSEKSGRERPRAY
jgi:hypothetical protein